MTDLVIRGRLALPGRGAAPGSLFVESGRFERIAGPTAAVPPGAQSLDFGDRLVLPGAVDAHVHFRDPGAPEKEDFASGTASAAFGGVTAVLDMPNTDPPVTTRAAFEAKLKSVGEKAIVDFGLFCGLADDASLDVLERATAIKTYLGASTGNLLVRDEALVARAIARAASLGKVAAFHAESQDCIDRHSGGERSAQDFEAHARSRPPACEEESIRALAALPRPACARVHVCHLSTARGLAALAGTGFTAEVAPHHLYFVRAHLRRGGWFKMNPPLRDEADREALWAGLTDGRIGLVASDHAPHTPREKGRGVWECPSGVPGVETLVPLLLAEVVAGRLPLPRLVEAACEAPARLYGLPKGRFAPGLDADFAVYDLADARPVRAERLHSRAGWTPFEGLAGVFPQDVWMRGERVIGSGVLVARGQRARFLPGAQREAHP